MSTDPQPAAEPVREPWQDLGAGLLVDEPSVKAWMEVVPPGESRPLHTHRHPWVTVVVAGGRGESRGPDGATLAAGEASTGDVRYNGPERLPYCQSMTNTSDQTIVMIAIELRNGAAIDSPKG